MTLPRALARFHRVLSMFPPELALSLGPLALRISRFIGPLSRPGGSGRGEPDGFEGISRRGRPERLLVSEWALAMEVEEEFLRRAAVGELNYLAPAERRPAGVVRSLVMLDAGPEVLGAPRVVGLAALFALELRCLEAKVPFAFAVFQDSRFGIITEISPASIRRVLESRTSEPPSTDQLRRWSQLLEPKAPDDIWIIGGHTIVELARGGDFEVASSLELGDGWDPAKPSVRARVLRPQKAASDWIDLALPSSEDTVRLLRDPFGVPAHVTPSVQVDVDPSIAPIFGFERRLLVGLADGRVAAIVIPGSIRATVPPPLVFRPAKGQEAYAASWSRGHVVLLTRRGPDLVLVEHGKRGGRVAPPVEWLGFFQAPPGPAELRPLWVVDNERRTAQSVAFVDEQRRLVLVARAFPDPAVVARDVRGASFVRGRLLFAGRVEGSGDGLFLYDPTLGPVSFRGSAPALVDPALDVGVASIPEVLPRSAGCVFFGRSGEGMDLIAAQLNASTFRVSSAHREQVLVAPSGTVVVGIARTPKERAPGLILLDDDRTAISIAGMEESAVLHRSRSKVAQVSVSGMYGELAFTTADAEVCVFDLGKGQLTLRLRGRLGDTRLKV
ncbi:MAG: hypothetical protein HY791_27365 [Deltaproteobacteria bacterium]|nr:hypothetical protein [Deltaproteobacteria bacterium]